MITRTTGKSSGIIPMEKLYILGNNSWLWSEVKNGAMIQYTTDKNYKDIIEVRIQFSNQQRMKEIQSEMKCLNHCLGNLQ